MLKSEEKLLKSIKEFFEIVIQRNENIYHSRVKYDKISKPIDLGFPIVSSVISGAASHALGSPLFITGLVVPMVYVVGKIYKELFNIEPTEICRYVAGRDLKKSMDNKFKEINKNYQLLEREVIKSLLGEKTLDKKELSEILYGQKNAFEKLQKHNCLVSDLPNFETLLSNIDKILQILDYSNKYHKIDINSTIQYNIGYLIDNNGRLNFNISHFQLTEQNFLDIDFHLQSHKFFSRYGQEALGGYDKQKEKIKFDKFFRNILEHNILKMNDFKILMDIYKKHTNQEEFNTFLLDCVGTKNQHLALALYENSSIESSTIDLEENIKIIDKSIDTSAFVLQVKFIDNNIKSLSIADKLNFENLKNNINYSYPELWKQISYLSEQERKDSEQTIIEGLNISVQKITELYHCVVKDINKDIKVLKKISSYS